jgi:hypothetical protein
MYTLGFPSFHFLKREIAYTHGEAVILTQKSVVCGSIVGGCFVNGVQAPAQASAAQRLFVLVLRGLGCMDLLALIAVLLPHEWMARLHALAGLGELPRLPLVGYLSRSSSLLYALHGAMIVFLSFDIARYGRLITFLALAALVHGALMLAIDVAESMPLWWIVVEGPGFAATGAIVLLLQGRAFRSTTEKTEG